VFTRNVVEIYVSCILQIANLEKKLTTKILKFCSALRSVELSTQLTAAYRSYAAYGSLPVALLDCLIVLKTRLNGHFWWLEKNEATLP